MALNSPEWSFIHESMAGSRSTAPLNRSNSALIVAPLFEIYGYVTPYMRRPLTCCARRNEKGYFLSNAVAFTDSEARQFFPYGIMQGLPRYQDLVRTVFIREKQKSCFG